MMDYEADRRMSARVMRLKRHWRWILGGTGFCGVAALVVSLSLPKVYRATTHLLVSESKISAGSPAAAWQFAMMGTYVPFVDNDALIDQAIKKFQLDQPPYDLTPERFRRKDYLDVRALRATRLVEVTVEFPDARLSAGLANFLAQGAAGFNDQLNATDTEATQKFLKQQLEQTQARLAEAEKGRLAVEEKARIEERENEVNNLLSEKEQISSQLQKLRLSLAQSTSQAQTLEHALRDEPRTFQLKKSVLADRAMERASEKLASEGAPPLAMTEETLNTTRERIQQGYVDSTASSASASAGIRETTARLAQLDGQLQRALGEVTRYRSEIEQADHNYTLAREAVDGASRDYRNASIVVSAKSQDLKQIDPALVPERPVRPKPLLDTVLGTLLGFCSLSGIALAFESFREMHAPVAPYFEEEHRVHVEQN